MPGGAPLAPGGAPSTDWVGPLSDQLGPLTLIGDPSDQVGTPSDRMGLPQTRWALLRSGGVPLQVGLFSTNEIAPSSRPPRQYSRYFLMKNQFRYKHLDDSLWERIKSIGIHRRRRCGSVRNILDNSIHTQDENNPPTSTLNGETDIQLIQEVNNNININSAITPQPIPVIITPRNDQTVGKPPKHRFLTPVQLTRRVANRLVPPPTLYLTNPQSVTNVFEEFENRVKLHQADIVAISETWFSDTKPSLRHQMQGYQLLTNDRPTRGGGVALYVREHLHIKKMH